MAGCNLKVFSEQTQYKYIPKYGNHVIVMVSANLKKYKKIWECAGIQFQKFVLDPNDTPYILINICRNSTQNNFFYIVSVGLAYAYLYKSHETTCLTLQHLDVKETLRKLIPK